MYIYLDIESCKSKKSSGFKILKIFLIIITLVALASNNVSAEYNITLSTDNEVYNLTENIYLSNGSGININATNVTLNCFGYDISGSNMTETYGIYLNYTRDITIINCNIKYFDYLIYIQETNDSIISNNTLSQSVREAMIINGTSNVIENNTINTSLVSIFNPGTDNSIINNTIISRYWVNNTGSAVFNDSIRGNTYYTSNGTPSWNIFNIIDLDANTYADNGTDRPFNSDLNDNYWTGNGEDWFPGITDNEYPLITFTSPTASNDAYTNNTYIQINISITEINYVNATLRIYNSSYTEINSTYNSTSKIIFINYTSLPDGIYYYNATTIDSYNRTNNTETRNITIDTIQPTINYTTNTDTTGTYRNGIYLQINITTNDTNIRNTTIRIFDSNGIIRNSTISYTGNIFLNYTNLTNATYYFNATIYDQAGNSNTTETRNITIDTINPNITINYPANGQYISTTNITINVTVNDTNIANTTIVSYYSNGTIANTTIYLTDTNIIYTPNLTDGLYYYNITTYDLARNSNTTETRNITIDTTNPTINYTTNTDNTGIYTNRTYIHINITANDTNIRNITTRIYNSTNVTINITTSQVGEFINITNLTDGTYKYNSTIYDLAGNSNTTETRNITIDTIIPNITINSPTNNYTFNSSNATLNISIIDSNIANTTVLIYNSTNSSINSTIYTTDINIIFSINLSNGTYYYNITSIDSSGNRNLTSNRNFTIAIATSQASGSENTNNGGSGGGSSRSSSSSSSSSGSYASSNSQTSSEGDVSYERTWLYLIRGNKTLEIEKENMPVTSIYMNITKSNSTYIHNLEIITSEKEIFKNHTKINAGIYKYLLIDSGLESDQYETIAIIVKIEKSWLEDNNLSKENLSIYSYSNNKWNNIKYQINEEEDSEINSESINNTNTTSKSNNTQNDSEYVYYNIEIQNYEYLILGTPIYPEIIPVIKEEIGSNSSLDESDGTEITTETIEQDMNQKSTKKLSNTISDSVKQSYIDTKNYFNTIPRNTKILLVILFATISTLIIISVAGTMIYRKVIVSKEDSSWFNKYRKHGSITPYEREPNTEAKIPLNNTNYIKNNNENANNNNNNNNNKDKLIIKNTENITIKPLSSPEATINKISDLIIQSENSLSNGRLEEAKKIYLEARTIYFNSGIDYTYKAKVYDKILKLHKKIYK